MVSTEWPFDVTTLTAQDGSITAKFISLGATLTELWVPDRTGTKRDVVLCYDENTKLLDDPAHPYYNSIVGRYANRMKDGRFSIPISANPPPGGANVYQIPTNDHDGAGTLHGGIYGWDRRPFTITAKSDTSVTYKHLDTQNEGFPGVVTVLVTFTVKNGGLLDISISGKPSEKTPIMATQHTYFNLDAFQDGSENILNHTLTVDASRVIAIDKNSLPTGEFIDVKNTPFNFKSPQKVGARWDETIGLYGEGSQGYDSCWVYDGDHASKPAVSLWSELSGIRMDITTNQPATQVYTSNFLDTPRKDCHGGPKLRYTKWTAIAIEQQGFIDAIHHPQWNQDQIYSPEREYSWEATYKFSTLP